MDAPQYSQLVQQILTKYARLINPKNTPNQTLIFDTQNDHYVFLANERHDDKRRYGITLHIDVIDVKSGFNAMEPKRESLMIQWKLVSLKSILFWGIARRLSDSTLSLPCPDLATNKVKSPLIAGFLLYSGIHFYQSKPFDSMG